MAFVMVSRTALVTVPIMFAVFALLHLRWRSIVIILCVAAAFAAVAWQTSPALRRTAETFTRDYQLYKEQNIPTSIGLRLEFWRKSLGFFAEAPLIGHGTGATRGLFERVATHDPNQASSEVIGNPHNQTLNVAVQWGIVGVVVLYAMWLLHLLLFRGDGLANWIGLLVVVQKSSPRCSTRTSSIFTKAGCMCWASASPAAWCCAPDPAARSGNLPELSGHDRWHGPQIRYQRTRNTSRIPIVPQPAIGMTPLLATDPSQLPDRSA